jgi:hypothetical protein
LVASSSSSPVYKKKLQKVFSRYKTILKYNSKIISIFAKWGCFVNFVTKVTTHHLPAVVNVKEAFFVFC